MITAKPKKISVFALVMINVIAIDSLRSIPFSAELGLPLITFYAIAVAVFFIPIALVSAQLAANWSDGGGVYTWVKAAFNEKFGFTTIFIQWLYNLVWFPTILSLLVTTLLYPFAPELANNKLVMTLSIIAIYWLITWINLKGIHASVKLSTITAVVGTLLPMLLISLLAAFWVYQGRPMQISFNLPDLIPDLKNVNLAILPSIIFGLVGIEMSAVHAREVNNPERDYPRAVLFSTIMVVGSLVCASLAVAIVVPQHALSLVSGLLDAFYAFLAAFRLESFLPIVALLIVLGGIGGVGAWMLGPAKALMVAANDNVLPKWLAKKNKNGVPHNLLLIQGVLFTLLASAFLLMPSINSAYWLLSNITAQLALVSYLFIFAAAVVIQKRMPSPIHYVSSKIYYSLCAVGFIGCLAFILIGFIPPQSAQVEIGNIIQYEMILILGLVFSLITPFYIAKKHLG